MSTVLENAIRLAVRAHEGQMRKGEPIPYITHPVAVALLLARYGFDDEVLAAALTHDVLEDTSIGKDELEHAIGSRATTMVVEVTNDVSLPWKAKKEAYIEQVRTASDGVKAIATADKIHNADSLLEAYMREGVSVWNRFNAPRDEKLWFENAMLHMLQVSWSHPLIDVYAARVNQLNALA